MSESTFKIHGAAFELNPEAQRMDGYDDCILGVAYRCGMSPVIAYDYDKVIEKLRKDGMTHEEAVEFFEFNQLGAWVGNGTPMFIERIE